MAYLDVMSDAAYGRYNIKLASIVGLSAAVYWSELLDIIGHVVKKNAFDEQGYFKIDRSYITARTSLTEKSQRECETILGKLGVLSIHPADADRLGVMCDKMMEILTDNKSLDEIKKAKKLTNLTTEEKAESKKRGILHQLKKVLVEPDDDLYKAYCNWMEVAYSKGLYSGTQVKLFQENVNNYSEDKKVKLDVINLCAVGGYKDAHWGIEKYERIHNKRSAEGKLSDQKIANGRNVNLDLVF